MSGCVDTKEMPLYVACILFTEELTIEFTGTVTWREEGRRREKVSVRSVLLIPSRGARIL